MAPAYAYIISNIFYADRVGIVGGNIGNSFLDIVAGTVILFIIAGMFHKKSQRLIESSGHFYRIHEIISAGFIDTEKVFPDGFGKRRLVNQWKVSGKSVAFKIMAASLPLKPTQAYSHGSFSSA